jgi:hypothetical protein
MTFLLCRNGTLLTALLALFALAPSAEAQWDEVVVSYSADTPAPGGQVLSNQLVPWSTLGISGVPFPPGNVLPRNARPNGYKRLPNGHHLLTFSNVVELGGVPGVGFVFPGDIIELDSDWEFVTFRLRMDTVGGFNAFYRHINVNAISIDPVDPSILFFSIDRSAALQGGNFLAGDIITYSGTPPLGFVLDGQTIIGRNINALDVADFDGQRYFAVAFESGGTVQGKAYSSHSVMVATPNATATDWVWFPMPNTSNLTPNASSNLKVEAFSMNLVTAPDGLFRDRFQN